MKQIFTVRIQKVLLVISLLFSVTGCDQLSKFAAREVIPAHGDIWLLPNHILVTLTQNTGAFLSLGANWPEQLRTLVFTVAVSLVLLGLTYLIFRRHLSFATTIALSFLLAGGLGNLIDRLYLGSVTDFLFVQLGSFSTGIFNIADMVILLGVSILTLENIRLGKQKKATSRGLSVH